MVLLSDLMPPSKSSPNSKAEPAGILFAKLLHFPRFLYLIYGQLAMSLRRVNIGWPYANDNISDFSTFENGQLFILSITFAITEISFSKKFS